MLTNSNNSKLPTSVISLSNSKQQSQHSQLQQHQQHHQNQTGNHLQQTSSGQQHIPPRYQPPPQPHNGILKHINHKTQFQYYPSELNGTHLNLKYPPDVPKLSNIYIPDGIKTSTGNQSRLIPPRATGLRLSSGIGGSGGGGGGGGVGGGGLNNNNPNPSNNLHATHRQQQQQQQQQQQPQLQTQSQSQSHHRVQNDEELVSRLIQPSNINLQQSQNPSQPNTEMLKFVRKSDTDPSTSSQSSSSTTPSVSNNTNSGRLSAEQNRHFQSLIAELRGLKEANQRLSDDNQELRDLCCFLDDDRQKGRKLAREWQRFGRYTASVMRQEVSAYQNKLRQLDDKQQELIRDNLELKELCLYLDEERANASANSVCSNCGSTNGQPLRDDGDGSSSSTNADEPMPNIRQYDRNEMNVRPTLSDQTLQYVRSLERRVRQLEEEQLSEKSCNTPTNTLNETIPGRPEAVVRALQVLEVREQLERDRIGNTTTTSEQTMDDGEKALVREMCNVVWRKLEDGTNVTSTAIDHL